MPHAATAGRPLEDLLIPQQALEDAAAKLKQHDPAKKIAYAVSPDLDRKFQEAGFKPAPWAQRELDIRFGFFAHAEKGGVIVTPWYASNYLTNLNDREAVRILEVLAAHDPAADPLVKEIAAAGANLVLTWEDLGYPGIRNLDSLFMERFAKAKALAESSLDPFRPKVRSHQYLMPEHHDRLIRDWRDQLQRFRTDLG